MVKTAITNIKLWRKNYSRQAKKETHIERQKEYQMLVTPAQVTQYMNSNHSTSAARLYKTLANDINDLSYTEYCILRDHLFVIIHFSNGYRSGVTVNMTTSEYEKAKRFPEREGFIIEVEDHKTDAVYGPAQVFFSDDEFFMLSTFVKAARSQLPPIDENIFLSWNGRKIQSGDVSKRLHCLAGIF